MYHYKGIVKKTPLIVWEIIGKIRVNPIDRTLTDYIHKYPELFQRDGNLNCVLSFNQINFATYYQSPGFWTLESIVGEQATLNELLNDLENEIKRD